MRTLLSLLCFPLALSAQPEFSDQAAAYGLASPGRSIGVAVGDYDNDGLEDLYVGRSGMPSLLYRAQPDGTFVSTGAEAGVAVTGNTRMVLWADLDNDGFLDLLRADTDGYNHYFHNDGDGTFSDRTEAAGLREHAYRTRSINVADIDGDGDLDIYTANLSEPNELFINDGTGYFTDECDLRNAQDELIAMGVIFFDYDLDGDQDLYVTHDSYQPNKLFENDGTGHFQEKGQFSGTAIAIQSMGVDVGDMDNDGDFDIYVTNLGENVLLRNTGIGFFQNSSFVSGATDGGMGWGTTWWDADNDGYQDIYVANEYGFAPFPNILYRNNGDNSFSEVSSGTVLESPYGGYGMATLDVNYDGRLELFQMNNTNDVTNQLFVNETPPDGHWLRLQLEQQALNRFAVGARVVVQTDDYITTDAVTVGSGYASQNSYRLHFGLGNDSLVDLQVLWPDGDTSFFADVAADSLYRLRKDEAPTGLYPLGLPVTTSLAAAPVSPDFSLLQNPVAQTLRLRSTAVHAGPVELRIHTAAGKSVYRKTLPGGLTFETNELAHLPPGYYVCFLKGKAGTQAIPFVKE